MNQYISSLNLNFSTIIFLSKVRRNSFLGLSSGSLQYPSKLMICLDNKFKKYKTDLTTDSRWMIMINENMQENNLVYTYNKHNNCKHSDRRTNAQKVDIFSCLMIFSLSCKVIMRNTQKLYVTQETSLLTVCGTNRMV